jgi:SAM-dependent methyltransferase
MADCLLHYAAKNSIAAAGTIKELVASKKFQELIIGEFNKVPGLHAFLSQLPQLYYSEYGSSDRSIPSEDLMKLSHPGNFFNMILHSETLEHVPNYRVALGELYRVLRPGGVCMFTIPIVDDGRQTISRAEVVNDTVVHHKHPSYHGSSKHKWADYLVFHEFGIDFIKLIESIGFCVSVFKDAKNPALICIIAEKPIE